VQSHHQGFSTFITHRLQELVLGFVDYTSSESVLLHNCGWNVASAFERFAAASHGSSAESFLRRNVFVSSQAQENPGVVDRVVSSMLQ
jgi:hypothetical protein